MFAIYRKDVGGRVVDRYFKDYNAAKTELKHDVERMRDLGSKVTERIDRFNSAKGFYEYEVRMLTAEGEKCSQAIVDGYFEDNPDL